MSIRRHLQKHGLAHADSDSDLEHEECEFCKSACTTQQMHRTRLCQGAWVYFHFKKTKTAYSTLCAECVSLQKEKVFAHRRLNYIVFSSLPSVFLQGFDETDAICLG